ncbi:hypothetical protein BT93_L2597 [Corymbia citriodora subsp. variegata]|uniref:Uncharacterized protein n=1 Tax=Corymbia citriodora subsp. variegata TaxID=360336 RepID=A0A8T0CW21_CORYI|nr:hypothetical protein BT93_L2597 [Corymbia citriodora subsp. variegata]
MEADHYYSSNEPSSLAAFHPQSTAPSIYSEASLVGMIKLLGFLDEPRHQIWSSSWRWTISEFLQIWRWSSSLGRLSPATNSTRPDLDRQTTPWKSKKT